MKFYTKHTLSKGETYFQHMAFAGKTGLLFAVASVLFIIHAIIPCVGIPKRFNLDAMSTYLQVKRP